MSSRTTILALVWLLSCAGFAMSADRPARVTTDLIVLYTFERPSDDIIRDRSGVGDPLDLRFDKAQGLTWRGDRLMVTSDVDNRLLGKMRPQRLQAEILRDAMLAVSGTLNRQMCGPGFKPPISSEAMVARNTKDPYPAKVEDSAALRRRSVYMFHKRVVPYPLLQAFDKPDAQQSCNRRDPTTVAPQALALLNDQFVRTVALDFADRLIKEAGAEPPPWIDLAYQLALGRSPSESERTASLEFVQTQIKERSGRSPQTAAEEIRRRALADLCQAWFSLNEFLYID